MALTGVERLVQFARDLDVAPARAPRVPQRAAEPVSTPRSDGDGVKLSLSSRASDASEAATAPPSSSTAAAYAQDLPDPRPSESGVTTRRGSPLDAYQRTSQAELGQRVTIRA